MSNEVRKLIEGRDRPYGNAWQLTGLAIFAVKQQFEAFMDAVPHYIIPWMMILNKLMRLLFDPDSRDNWVDIAGYVELVLRHMDEGSHETEDARIEE
mgnify:CR=1 FL=1